MNATPKASSGCASLPPFNTAPAQTSACGIVFTTHIGRRPPRHF